MSAWQARHGFRAPRVRARLVALHVEPEELTRRITARVRGWLDTGWVDEVSALMKAGYGEARAMGSVGYRDVRGYLEGVAQRDPDLARAARDPNRPFNSHLCAASKDVASSCRCDVVVSFASKSPRLCAPNRRTLRAQQPPLSRERGDF